MMNGSVILIDDDEDILDLLSEYLLLEDFYDKLTFATTQGNWTNLYTGSSVPPKF